MAQMDKLYLMQLFVKIIHLGTFSAAAQKMGITASKASKDIQLLEQTLGCKLLNRSTRSIGITSAGELYYKTAVEILASYDGLVDNLNYMKQHLTGELRITAPDLWGNEVLTPLIMAFKQTYPDVSIRAHYSNAMVDLVQENIHIAFRSTELNDQPYLSKPLAADISVLCASRSYFDDKAMPICLSELEALDFISFSQNENSYNNLTFDYQGQKRSIQLQGALSFNSKQAIFNAVRNNLGIANLPEYLVRDGLAKGEIVALLPDYKLPEKTFYAFYSQRKQESRLVSSFIEFAQSALAKQESCS